MILRRLASTPMAAKSLSARDNVAGVIDSRYDHSYSAWTKF